MRRQEREPNAENATSEELKVAMEAASTKRSYIRLGAMRLLLEGMERELVCKIYNRSDRMVRLWIEMFNRGGIIFANTSSLVLNSYSRFQIEG